MQENIAEEIVENESDTKIEESVEETPEFTDSEAKVENNEETKETPKGEKSSYYAQLRREREQAKKEKKENSNEYLRGVIKGTSGKNPYTNKEIKDEIDLAEYELMTKLQNEGKDPIGDYLDALKAKERESKQKELELQEKKQNKFKEFDDFVDKYGQDKLKEIVEDKDFLQFADNFKDDVSITRIYDLYNNIKTDVDRKAENLAKDKYARLMSSTGGTSKGEPIQKSFKDMSTKEFKEYQQKVLNGEI